MDDFRKWNVPFPFKKFPSYNEITKYLRDLEKRFPDLCQLETIGKTKKNDIILVKLQKDPHDCNTKERPIVYIDALYHAREWITCSTALYFINFIMRHRSWLKRTNFYIVPCVNVDGYVYTMQRPENRLWRKNRNCNFSCMRAKHGVDLNRNFPVGFGRPGSSSNPKEYNYHGVAPLSEPETKAVAHLLGKYSRKIQLYVSLHNYGNAIIHPWCYTSDPIQDKQELIVCADTGRIAIERFSKCKRKMRIGTCPELVESLELAAGTSIDYARLVHRIKYSYIFELEQFGKSGFTPKVSDIDDIGFETTLGILIMVLHINLQLQMKNGCESNDGILGFRRKPKFNEDSDSDSNRPSNAKVARSNNV